MLCSTDKALVGAAAALTFVFSLGWTVAEEFFPYGPGKIRMAQVSDKAALAKSSAGKATLPERAAAAGVHFRTWRTAAC